MSQRYPLPPNTKTLCLSMAYVLKAGASIELYQSQNYFSFKQIPTINKIVVTKGDDWNVAKFDVIPENPNSTNIWFYLVGTVGQNLSCFAAIDDIAVDYNHCTAIDSLFNCKDDGTERIPLNKVCDFQVDCSNGRDEMNCGSCHFSTSFCSYEVKQSNSSSFKWNIIKASNGYIYAKQDSQFDQKSIAELVTPVINYASSSCRLSFQYHFGNYF